MIEFSKMMDRGKSPKSGRGRPGSDGTGGLNMSKLSIRKSGQERAERRQDSRDSMDTQGSQATIEKRKILYIQLAEYLGMAFSSVQADKLFSLQPGFKLLEKIVDTRTPIDALFLKAIHDEDSYDLMVSPSVNVAIYAIKMAENLGFSKTRQVEIGMVGLLHDIGMAKISDALIYKQNLTDDEFLVFKERPKYGFDILQSFNKDYAYLAECTLQIHERADGSGYPLGLQADEINEYAQIIGLVDIYEALIHARPQREKILHFYAVKEIIKTGKDKFQNRFLKALLNTFSIFPLNSYVRLNSGAIGRVTRTYPDQPMRPKVQIIYDSQSKRILMERFINLPENSLLYIVDSVSEQELINLSEASYLVTKPGRSRPDTSETENEPDTHPEIDKSDEGRPEGVKPATRLSEARAAKPKSTLLKRCLLVLAGFFFAAGVAWQFLADDAVNGNVQGTLKVAARAPEQLKTKTSVGKASRPEKAAPHIAIPQKLPEKPEGSVPENSVAKKSHDPVQATPPAMIQAQEVNNSASQPVFTESKKAVPVEDSPLFADLEKSVFGQSRAKNIGPPEPGRYPYSILLASYRELRTVRVAIAEYRPKGLDPYWVKVNLGTGGIWYRLFYGHYADSKAALAVIGQLKLEGARPKPTRYATWVGAFPDQKNLDARIAELSNLGFSTYVVADGNDIDQLYVGAFYTREGAADQHANLKSAGIDSRIVER